MTTATDNIRDALQDICFEWLNWPQAHVPFDAKTTAYIAALDAEADLATLAEHGLVLRSDCKRVFRATTMCLKLGAAAGLTPYAIGSIMCVAIPASC
jgi:Phosphatidylinositol 3- and 4-kinase